MINEDVVMKVNALIAGVQKGGTTGSIFCGSIQTSVLSHFSDEGAFLNPSPHYRRSAISCQRLFGLARGNAHLFLLHRQPSELQPTTAQCGWS